MAAPRTSEQEGMAKLQKKPRQVARHTNADKTKAAAKLTPAEIRAQNNTPTPRSSHSHRRHSDHVRRARQLDQLDHPTPPASPDKAPTAYEKQRKLSSTTPLPTPPHSPVLYYARTIDSPQRPTNFSLPRTNASMHADQLVTSALSSRRSSVSSYRGLPTYRGPEMTRTGSFTLLQHPSQQIVANPLSNFSRPRRNLSASPARSKLSLDGTHICDHDDLSNLPRRRSETSISAVSDTPRDFDGLEPPERNVSPISFEANQSIRDFSIVKDGVVVSGQIAPSISSSAGDNAHMGTAKPITVSRMDSAEAFRRHGQHQQANTSSKLRRNTMPASGLAAASAYSMQKARDVDAEDTAEPKYGPHPAVRPLSVAIPPTSILKGKERESGSYSAPIVRCCHKCGKHKKPGLGEEGALSPVLEHPRLTGLKGAEGLTMSGGVGSPQQQSPPPSRSPKQLSGVKWEDRRNEGKIRPPPPPTIMRFASLRGYTTEGLETGGDTDSGIFMSSDAEGETANTTTHEQVTTAQIQAPVQGDGDDPNWEVVNGNALTGDAEQIDGLILPREQQIDGSKAQLDAHDTNIDMSFLTQAFEKPWKPLQDSASSESESDADKRRRAKIPRPTLEPRFARSNQTLRGLVVPKGQSTTNLLDAVTYPEREAVVGPERPSTAPNATTHTVHHLIHDMERSFEDGDITKGLELSKSIDGLREKQAQRLAEIIAV